VRALGLFLVAIGFVLCSTVVEKPTGLGFSIPIYEYRDAGLTLMAIGAFLGFAGFVGYLYFNYQNEVSSYEYLGRGQQPQYPGYPQQPYHGATSPFKPMICPFCHNFTQGTPYCGHCGNKISP